MTSSEPLAVESLLTRDDWSAFQRAWEERLRGRIGRLQQLGATLGSLLSGALLIFALRERQGPFALAAFLVGACTTLGTIAWLRSLSRRFSLPDDDGLILGRVRIELTSEGIRTLRGNSTALTRWSALRDVTRTDVHLLLWVDSLSAYILPLRDLPPRRDADAVIERVREFAGASFATTRGHHESVAAAIPAPGNPVTTAGREGCLAAATGRVVWCTRSAGTLGSGDTVILTCAVAALAVWLAFDRYAAGAGAEWYAAGVTGLAWYASGLLALAWVLHRASSGALHYRSLLASLLGTLPLALALGLALHHWAPERVRSVGYVLLALASALQVRRSLPPARGGRQPRALIAGALSALLFAWGTTEAWVYPHLWYPADDGQEDATPWSDSERLLFEQAARIDAATARLAPGRPHIADVFFLGFAGVGEQKVFAEERELTERVVAERYAATGRSLLLVNDRRDRERRPLATVHGLRRALARLGERMDRDEDVLFLMLTSHGSDAPSLSVSNGIWPLERLEGRTLRAALDASGIRWRVIVISACHSGAFIDQLADENTIVLTSASKDRSSFGCSDDRDVTEFGSAFIRDALPPAESLASAFERACVSIAERERQEKIEASAPQAYYGRAIGEHWKRVEAERQRTRQPGQAPGSATSATRPRS